jgi:hypothetical protein
MDVIGRHDVDEVRFRKTKATYFLHMWKVDPKDKHIYNNKHDHIQIHMQNVFAIVELLYGTWGKKEGKENDRISVIS